MISYPKIANSYAFKNNKYDKKPHCVQIKYDGANFQIVFRRRGQETATSSAASSSISIDYASRTRVITDIPEHGFFNYKTALGAKLERIEAAIVSHMQTSASGSGDDGIARKVNKINLVGEFYGSRVLKRLPYTVEADFKIFDVFFDDALQSTRTLEKWLHSLGMSDLFVGNLMVGESLQECLTFDVDKLDNVEGVVIKPYDFDEISVPMSNIKEIFVKIKKADFVECERKPKTKMPNNHTQLPNTKNEYEFNKLINLNRVINTYSKKGALWDLDEFCAFVIADAQQDAQISEPPIAYNPKHVKCYTTKIKGLLKSLKYEMNGI